MRIFVCLAAVLATACTPYSLDLQQGNVINPDAVARLKAGMTRQQVGFVLGTPLIKDAFHADRWDYAYYVRKSGRYEDKQHIAVVFENDRLARLEGNHAPALAPATAAAPDAAPAGAEPAVSAPAAAVPAASAPAASAPANSAPAKTSPPKAKQP